MPGLLLAGRRIARHEGRRFRISAVLALSVVLTVPGGVAPVAQAADGAPGRPAVPEHRVSKVKAIAATGAKKQREQVAEAQARNAVEADRAAKEQKAAHWPKAGTVSIPLDGAKKAGRAVAGGLPVTVSAVPGKAAATVERVQVTVLDRRATEAAGVRGVLLTAASRAQGNARVTVDYGSFASVYGGGWSGRLRLVKLPGCALTTPQLANCRVQTPLKSANDFSARTLSAAVPLGASGSGATALAGASGATVLAATAGGGAGQSASGSGNYAATPLASSSTWEAGGSSGAFTWTYPMLPPKAAAGPSPSLTLSYNSGSVDGRTASTNNQGTSVGEGFELSTTSYIDRQYGSCDDDGHDKQYDLCWKYDNASLVLNGKASELVKDDTSGKWRLKNDDASTVIHSTDADLGNGDDNGEYWTVITGDGTKYVFGRHKLAGAGTERTNSVWTTPVFGDDAGEPGYSKGDAFGDRWLEQAWRWNLDYVVDTHGNAMSYWYIAESNYYKKNKASTANAKYIRGGYLNKILYGQRFDTLFGTDAPGKVGFSYAERCTASDCSELKETTAESWPDVPFDAICSSGAGDDDCHAESPSFFSRKRLTKIEAAVLSGTAYTPVDSWKFTQKYLDGGDIGDSSDQTLALESINRTGHTGTAITLDPVSFTYHMRPNRVDAVDDILPLTRPRIDTITSETGAITTVSYNEPECVRGSRMPAAEDNNVMSCYPLYWHINGAEDAGLDWFHKYRVVAVNTADPAGGNPLVEHAYTYEKPGWHYNESPFVPADERTWSIWRGYQKVTTLTGATTGTRSKAVALFMQGMNGDRRKDGSTRTATVPGIDFTGLNVPDVTDTDQYAGFTRQQITYDGATAVSVAVNDPWSARTAIQHKSYADVEAYYIRTGTTATHTYLTVPKSWRTAKTTAHYDAYGMVSKTDHAGDTAKSGDESCTRTWYARNDAVGINSLVSRSRTVGRTCGTAETDLTLPANSDTRGDVLSDTATVYDNSAATGWTADQTPTKGEASWQGRATGYPATVTGGERHPTGWQRTAKASFDALGRTLAVTDAGGSTTSTAFTPTGPGMVTRTIVTNVKGYRVVSYLDAVRGIPLRTYDANLQKTEQTYDGLGRLTAVWLPDRSKDGGQTPSSSFKYVMERGKAPSIATSSVKSSDTVITTYEIFDSLLRPLQTQKPTPVGGRLLTDARYDSRGLSYESYAGIFDSTTAPNGTYTRAEYGEAPKQHLTVFDGAGRATTSTFLVYGATKWSTTSSYTGDSTATSAVSGGKATRDVTDVLGRAVERREYAGTTPTDPDYGGASPGTPYTKTVFGFTRDGRPAEMTGPDNAKWSVGYDLFGRQTSSTDPVAGKTTTGYTPLDQVDRTEDAEGRKLLYGYDELGRRSAMWTGTKTDATKLVSWTYDGLAKGLLDSATRYDGGLTGKAYSKAVLAYDAFYRVTKSELRLDANDPLVKAGAARTSYTFESAFNLDGTLQYSTEPAAGGLAQESINYKYTPTGQITDVSGTAGYLQAASYSSLGQPQQLTLGVSAAAVAKKAYLNNEFEAGTDRITRSYLTTQTTPYKPQDLSYSYDQAGNVIKVSDTPALDATSKTDSQCFTYDGHRRLTEAWTPATDDCTSKTLGGAAPYRSAYTYNHAGLRTTETQTTVGGTSSTTNYCYNDASRHQILTATAGASCTGAAAEYEYDKTGNTTKRPGTDGSQALTWNAEARLHGTTEGSTKTDYLYDADGSLLVRRAIGDGESVLYLGATEIHHKVTGSTSKTWATRHYGLVGGAGAVRSNESGTQQVSFLMGNHHGTSGLALDATSQSVTRRYTSPFGAARGGAAGTWPDDKRFLGATADVSTGLTHLGAREYDPRIGRFISIDPVLEITDAQTLNGYSYASNNPVTYSDPTGRTKCDVAPELCGRPSPPPPAPPSPTPSPSPSPGPPPPGHGTGNGQGTPASGGGGGWLTNFIAGVGQGIADAWRPFEDVSCYFGSDDRNCHRDDPLVGDFIRDSAPSGIVEELSGANNPDVDKDSLEFKAGKIVGGAVAFPAPGPSAAAAAPVKVASALAKSGVKSGSKGIFGSLFAPKVVVHALEADVKYVDQPGVATVYLDQTQKHATIMVQAGDAAPLHTEQVITDGVTTGAIRTAAHSAITFTVRIPLPKANVAMAYQEVTLGAPLGAYDLATNSCVTYCAKVLRAGGVTDIPTTTKDATGYLFKRHG
ncbi:RHS repeat-associated core domain-containing protein [Streptomyces sp. ME08-AFT2]|uniref:RHS repeat-associated core domain-containing protein n=1 Tax=Streptomyces sp. ME08-AFT2 TaxID=3028683 RepID=UPI0029B3D3F6|nr:RHS repeat-associated core domain-containing protein [Streptomyces sp. ME08-AFT2]MDX3314913.1 RHS repeat-associated core domain-containing protein [Streptomyces sp. ME08-AFT2]